MENGSSVTKYLVTRYNQRSRKHNLLKICDQASLCEYAVQINSYTRLHLILAVNKYTNIEHASFIREKCSSTSLPLMYLQFGKP